ncbi:Protein UGT-63 [Aphelenchoides avenae]|nr:Protein UGT-63 [Aphelenchus avenae]
MDLINLVWYGIVREWDLPHVYADADRTFGEVLEKYSGETLNDEYDLVVTDDLFCAVGFWTAVGGKRRYQRPYMFFGTTQMKYNLASAGARGRNWVSKVPMFAYIPTSNDDYYKPELFWNRLYAFFENFSELVGMNVFGRLLESVLCLHKDRNLVEKFLLPNIARFGVPNFTWHELYKGSSMQLSDAFDRMGWPMPEAPEVKSIGSYCSEPKPLEGELETFVNDPKSKGTIYIAFGTYAQWDYVPKHVIDAFVTALNRFEDYRVIFSYNGKPIPVKKHVKLVKWAPQADILAHTKTKVFVSHGGLKSMKEAICGAVPLVVMPLFAEQSHNAHMTLALRMGTVLNKYTVDCETAYRTIRQVLTEPAYAERARKLKAFFLDRPIPSLDEAVFYTERVLKAPNGRIAFQRKGMDLSWVEFVYYEVLLTVVGLVFLLQK